jgi:phosphatidate phosphatase PAH1
MLVHGDHSVAAFNLYVLEPNTSTVVFDIDGTLTTTDFQLVSELFSDIFNGSYVADFYPDGRETTLAWRDSGAFVVFVTARPDWLRPMTSNSLIAGGFPRAALHFTDTNGQSVPTSGGTGQYKIDFLALLKSQAQVNFVAAYGNASTDIEAYEANAIAKDVTYIIGANGGDAGTTAIESYTAHLPTITPIPTAAVPGPPTYGWE